jgi:hypothetical protein
MLKRIVLIATLILMLGVSLSACAQDNMDAVSGPDAGTSAGTSAGPATQGASGSDAEQALPYAESSPGPADPGAQIASGETPEGETIPEEETPLSIKPYELGWSVVNLLATLLTIIIGVVLVVLSMVQRSGKDQTSNSFGLTVFGMAAAVISTILFVSTEDMRMRMIAVDSFTVAHVAVLAVAVLCAALSVRKEAQDPVLK